MIRFVIFILSIFVTNICFAQNLSVSSFKLLETDLTANTSGTMERDQNGETAALIKVVTTQTGFTFDGGALGIVKTKQTPGELWVYIPRGAKKITIKHPNLGVLRDYYYPYAIESGRSYEMILVTGEVQTVVKQARTSQYVVFVLSPSDAIVELNGDLLKTEGGTAAKMMKFGTYDYRVQAPDYLPEAGKVTVNDPNNKHIVNVRLKANYSQVTFSVDNDAEIWLNGEMKGKGTWTGNLGAGTYELETKKKYHKSTFKTYEISVTSEPQTIQLQAPSPIYGEVDIKSSPAMADVIIDGESVGQTPLFLDKLLIGPHNIYIKRDGYGVFSSSFSVEENKVNEVNAILNNIIKVKISCNDPSAELYIDNVKCGLVNGEKDIEVGRHVIEIKPGFFSDLMRQKKEIDINGNESNLEFILEPKELSVFFKSDQPYTYLFVNGKIISNTIGKDPISFKFKPGVYKVSFRCKGKDEIIKELEFDSRHKSYSVSFKNKLVELKDF